MSTFIPKALLKAGGAMMPLVTDNTHKDLGIGRYRNHRYAARMVMDLRDMLNDLDSANIAKQVGVLEDLNMIPREVNDGIAFEAKVSEARVSLMHMLMRHVPKGQRKLFLDDFLQKYQANILAMKAPSAITEEESAKLSAILGSLQNVMKDGVTSEVLNSDDLQPLLERLPTQGKRVLTSLSKNPAKAATLIPHLYAYEEQWVRTLSAYGTKVKTIREQQAEQLVTPVTVSKESADIRYHRTRALLKMRVREVGYQRGSVDSSSLQTPDDVTRQENKIRHAYQLLQLEQLGPEIVSERQRALKKDYEAAQTQYSQPHPQPRYYASA
jgi:hypothetical protein